MKLIYYRATREKPLPCSSAIPQGGDLFLVMEDNSRTDLLAVRLQGNSARDAIPRRYDLSGLLRGKRVIKYVPAGCSNIIMGEDGVMTINIEPSEIEYIPV
jgi:hypothetical protein